MQILTLVTGFLVLGGSLGFIRQKCHGRWGDWSKWKGKCNGDCSGVRFRTRSCLNTGFFYCSNPQCKGQKVDYDACGGEKVDGGWSAWAEPECHYCNQKRLRTRTCENPEPKCGGKACVGESSEVFECGSLRCPSLGNLITHHQDFTCGSTISVSCPPCHDIIGSSTLKCLPDGRWNKKPPTCIKQAGVEAQWSKFGPWSSECNHCHQEIYRSRTCRSSCGQICVGNSTERHRCGIDGCSLSSFVKIDQHLISSHDVVGCGETIKLKCLNSKILVGKSEIKCGLGGWEDMLPTCEDQACPVLPEFPHGKIISTGITYGKFAQFRCKDEYELVGQQYLVCLGNRWSYPFPACQKKIDECPEFTLTEHLVAVKTADNRIGSEVHFNCSEGYRIKGIERVYCKTDGRWSGHIPICIKKLCDPLPIISNADVSYYQHTNGGMKAWVDCMDGYTIYGHTTLSCLGTGLWDHAPPNCSPNICTLPHDDHGVWERMGEKVMAVLRCDPGYHGEGPTEIMCGNDKTWVSSIGKCVVKECPKVPFIRNGVINTIETKVGTVVSITCGQGFDISGSRKLECLTTGNWSHEIPICMKSDCPPIPVVDNGFTSSTHLAKGSVITVNCELGYDLRGKDTITCLNSGKWSSAFPKCKLVSCVVPPIHNSTVTVQKLPLGAELPLSCEPGFYLEGDKNMVCNEKGKIATKSVCLPVACPVFTLENGNVQLSDLFYGSVAEVTCDHGYHVNDTTRPIKCQENGKWNVDVECRLTKCPKRGPLVKKGNFLIKKVTVGSKADLLCDLWYKPKRVTQAECSRSGVWEVEDADCTPVSCPRIRSPDNGHFMSLSDGSVRLKCDEGYRVKGVPLLSCYGKSDKWSSKVPSCVLDIQCPKLTVPVSATVSTMETDIYTQVYIKCKEGHLPSSPYPIVCNASGMWNSSLPTCSFPDCEDLSDNPGILTTGNKVGDTATLKCDWCEKTKGNKYSVCESGGQWEPPIGSCEPVVCSTKINRRLYESVEGEIPTKCDKSVTFICKPGFTTIGRTTITCFKTGQYDYHVPFCVQSGIFKVRQKRRRRRK